MPKVSRQVGSTSQVLLVHIQNCRSVSGGGLTGLLYNAQSLQCYYKRNKGTASVAVTLASISTLGTYVSGGFKEVDATNCPGLYEFHPPDAAFVSGADDLVFYITGYINMVPKRIEIELTATNNQDGVHFGVTSLPNAAAGTTGGLPTAASGNAVTIQTTVKKNTSLNAFSFLMVDSSGLPVTGLTVNAQRSIDGAALGSCTHSVTELSNGIYLLDLSSSDLNGTVITLRLSATGASDNVITLLTSA